MKFNFKRVAIWLLCLVMLSSTIGFVSAGFGDDFGYNSLGVPQLPPEINFSKMPTTNSTDNWVTNIGSLSGVNETQHEKVNFLLTIKESWLTTFGLARYLDLAQTNWFNDPNGWIYWEGDDTITFNESKFDPVYHNPTQAGAVIGTIDGGTLADVQHPDAEYDGVTFNFSEEVAGLDLRMNFTGLTVTDFKRGIMRYKTSNLKGDFPIVQMWSYGSNTWEDYPAVFTSETFTAMTQPVFDGADHIGDTGDFDGVAMMRIYKDGGNTQNHYYVDWVAIVSGIGLPSGSVDLTPYARLNDSTQDITADTYSGNWSGGNIFGNVNGSIVNSTWDWVSANNINIIDRTIQPVDIGANAPDNYIIGGAGGFSVSAFSGNGSSTHIKMGDAGDNLLGSRDTFGGILNITGSRGMQVGFPGATGGKGGNLYFNTLNSPNLSSGSFSGDYGNIILVKDGGWVSIGNATPETSGVTDNDLYIQGDLFVNDTITHSIVLTREELDSAEPFDVSTLNIDGNFAHNLEPDIFQAKRYYTTIENCRIENRLFEGKFYDVEICDYIENEVIAGTSQGAVSLWLRDRDYKQQQEIDELKQSLCLNNPVECVLEKGISYIVNKIIDKREAPQL